MAIGLCSPMGPDSNRQRTDYRPEGCRPPVVQVDDERAWEATEMSMPSWSAKWPAGDDHGHRGYPVAALRTPVTRLPSRVRLSIELGMRFSGSGIG